jgi:hypothetical protein
VREEELRLDSAFLRDKRRKNKKDSATERERERDI